MLPAITPSSLWNCQGKMKRAQENKTDSGPTKDLVRVGNPVDSVDDFQRVDSASQGVFIFYFYSSAQDATGEVWMSESHL